MEAHDIIDFLDLRDKYSQDIQRVGCTRYEQGNEVNSRVAYAFIRAAENGLDIDSVIRVRDRKGDLEVTFAKCDGILASNAVALSKAWEECGECSINVRMYQS
jgi:hypothetical protein